MALTQISTAGVKDDAVTAGKIPANAVGSSELADNAVDTNAIQNDAVTADKLADSAVGTSNIVDGTVSLAKLPHGTSSNDGKFLRANNGADPSFETVSIPAGTTINNNADNRVITGSGTANTLEGEVNLTFNGTQLNATPTLFGSGNVNKAQDGVIIQRNSVTGTSEIIAGRSGGNYGGLENYVAGASGVTKRSQIDYQSIHTWYGADGSTERMKIDTNGHTRFGPSGDGGDSSWSHSSYGNTEVAIDSSGGYAVLHLRGEGAGSTAARFSIGVGDDKHYLSYDDVDQRHNIVVSGDGVVSIPNGIELGSGTDATPAGNILDDYEEGTFSITAGGGSNATFGASDNAGSYTKIGRQVTIAGQFRVSGGNNALRIGLPFSASGNTNDSDMSFAASVIGYDYNAAGSSDCDGLFIMIDTGQAYARFMEHRDNAPWADLLCDPNAYMRFTLTYFTA